MSFFFFLYWPPSSSLYIFDSNSSNIDEVLSINPSANLFVFGDFTVCHKGRLTYSNGTDNLVNSVIIILSQMKLLRWLTFLLASLTVTLTVSLFWIYLFYLTLVFFLKWLSLHWEILIMLLPQYPFTFCKTQIRMPHFTAQVTTILVLIGTVFMII